MKLLALLTPAAMLAVLWALEPVEVWLNHPPGHIRRPHRGGLYFEDGWSASAIERLPIGLP